MDNASGRDVYAQKYTDNIDFQTQWLQLGGEYKSESVIELCARLNFKPQSIIEVGAGTGAVISALRRKGLGQQHTALDFSAEALSQLKKLNPDITTIQGDVTAFSNDESYDLVVCSHVLEHLENPALALKNIKDHIQAKYYIFEVPLEDLPLGRMRNSGAYRRSNGAGHVQFYHPQSFRNLISAELKIVGERIYCPSQSLQSVRLGSGQSSPLKLGAKWMTQGLLPKVLQPFWKHYWYGHMAVITQAV